MKWPQTILCVFIAMRLSGAWNQHGKMQSVLFGTVLIRAIILLSLLSWGGFWK